MEAAPAAATVETAAAAEPEAVPAAATVEEAAAEPEAVAVTEAQPAVSIEEQLAEVALGLETAQEAPAATVEEAAAADISQIPDSVWAVPQAAPQSQRIRFAEDIMAPRSDATPDGRRGRRAKGRPARGARGVAEEPAPRSGGRRARRSDYPLDEDSDAVDDMDDLGG